MSEDFSFENASPVPPTPQITKDQLTAELRGQILQIMAGDLKSYEKPAEIGRAVVTTLQGWGRLYYHATLRDHATAMFFDAFGKRLSGIQSDGFLSWVSALACISRSDRRFAFIATAIEDAALIHPESLGIVPENFWCARPGRIYLSSGDARIARITAGSVEFVDNGTDGILFAVGQTLSPWQLVEPQDPFEACSVFHRMNCAADHGRDLFQLWSYSLPTGPRSKPPVVLTGDVGSGKTRALKGLAELFGFPFVAIKAEEDAEKDFWPAINGGGLVVLDNSDTRTKWIPDALAAAATDGCVSRRRLYTNSENVVLRANAWIGVTSANPTFGNDPGLADRVMLVRLLRRIGENADTELSEEIAANRDAGLSHLAWTLAAALADTGPVPSGLNSRHPDFARFAVRIGRAIGREERAVAALQAAEADKSAFCIENDPLTAALLELVNRDGRVAGTAKEIGPMLADHDPSLEHSATPKRLGKKLNAIWPHLEKVVQAHREQDRKGFWLFAFKPLPPHSQN